MHATVLSFISPQPFCPVARFVASESWAQTELIAFDYDGVVGDTEPHQMKAFISVAMKHGTALPEHGIDYAPFVRRMIGKPEAVILNLLKGEHEIANDIDDLLAERAAEYLAAARVRLKPNPHALMILEAAKECGKRAIILSNGRSQVLGALNNHWGIGHFFSEMQTIDVRAIGNKANYLIHRAAEQGLDTSRIMLLEDSVSTIQDAQTKRIPCGFFRHSLNDPTFVPETGLVFKCHNPADAKAESEPRARLLGSTAATPIISTPPVKATL